MSEGFGCEALYHGWRGVEGSQSPSSIAELVEKVLSDDGSKTWSLQVHLNEERLKLIPVRKDEGFESDSDGSNGSVCEELPYSNTHMKGIQDHMLRLDKLLMQKPGATPTAASNDLQSQSSIDANSISSEDSAIVKKEDNNLSSSGAESEGDSSPLLQRMQLPNKGMMSRDVSFSESTNSSLSLSSDIQTVDENYTKNHGVNLFPLCDIVFCHICSPRSKIVVFIVKIAKGSHLRAHIIECFTQQTAKTLYSHYNRSSNQYKLKRYRNSKRKCDFNRELASMTLNYRAKSDSSSQSSSRKDSGVSTASESEINGHDLKNVNVIEISSNDEGNIFQSLNLEHHPDENGITQIEIGSGPVSMVENSSIVRPSTRTPDKITSNFGKSKSLRDFDRSCLNSLIYEEDEKKFRQRQPAKLLQDEMEIFDYQHSRKDSNVRDSFRNRNDNYHNEEVEPITIPPPAPFRNPPERPSRSRELSKIQEDLNSVAKSKHNKGPAPLPPMKKKQTDANVVLVPTKSGHEPKSFFYPKESHIVRGNKVVRVDFPSVPVWTPRVNQGGSPRHYIHYTGGWSHEFHAPRIREPNLRTDMRRRARSKSPASRPISTNKYLDAVSNFNISQKLKLISDVVFSGKKSDNSLNLPPLTGRSNQRSKESITKPIDPENLRPVIKKDNMKAADSENRRVTFNAYATVQLMDS